MIIVTGLGNSGDEYTQTRHNTGRELVEAFRKKEGFVDWKENRKTGARESAGKIGKESILLLLPEKKMNASGKVLSHYVRSKKALEHLIVVYDDIDLPLGRFKISFGRGSGGHRGVESIIKALGSRDFVRVRVGISKGMARGGVKKPVGEQAVIDFILGEFRKPEKEILKRERRKILEALVLLITEGREKAMNIANKSA